MTVEGQPTGLLLKTMRVLLLLSAPRRLPRVRPASAADVLQQLFSHPRPRLNLPEAAGRPPGACVVEEGGMGG